MTRFEELAAIEKAKKGDADAFEELVISNQKRVYNLALKLTGSEQDALDISQEVFIKAYTNLESFRKESRFSVWLYRMTYNACVDLLRKNGRFQTVSLSAESDDESYEIEIPDGRLTPEGELERKELQREIDEGLSRLPEEHRRILVMREVSGMSYREIADTIGISEGTVKSRISRARQGLVKILVERGTFPISYRQKEGKEGDVHE